MDSRKLIDYALDEDGVEFRAQLYATLHDRVMAAMESRKQSIAQNLVTQEEVELDDEDSELDEGANHPDEAEDRKMVRRMVKSSALKEEDDELDEAAKWRSSSAAVPNVKHDPEVADFDRTATGGSLRSKADTPIPYGSISSRTRAKIASTGERKGKATVASMNGLKDRIRANRSLQDEFDNELEESWEDRLAAAREKAAAKGKIKEPQNKPSGVTKHAGTRYGGAAQRPAEKPGHEEDEEETVSSKKGMKKEEEKWHMRKSK